jgi:hypothetical protein
VESQQTLNQQTSKFSDSFKLRPSKFSRSKFSLIENCGEPLKNFKIKSGSYSGLALSIYVIKKLKSRRTVPLRTGAADLEPHSIQPVDYVPVIDGPHAKNFFFFQSACTQLGFFQVPVFLLAMLGDIGRPLRSCFRVQPTASVYVLFSTCMSA